MGTGTRPVPSILQHYAEICAEKFRQWINSGLLLLEAPSVGAPQVAREREVYVSYEGGGEKRIATMYAKSFNIATIGGGVS
jgi:hypothetical protein